MSPSEYTSDEMMTVSAARMLQNGAICFVGIGLPSTAANLARLTHAPDVVLIYESGPIGAKPNLLPLSIGDGELAETADTVVSTPEVFRYWLQGGRVDVGFLGAAQIDRFANINTTVIGDYHSPTVRLPGAGGAPEISSNAKQVLVIVRQSRKTFVEKLDFITSVGFLTGGDARKAAGIRGGGPAAVITDLCILHPRPPEHELIVTSIHPGIAREHIADSTSWKVRFAEDCHGTAPPAPHELEALRDLHERTRAAHAGECR
ncbi:MAG: CoA-transferase subunit beta [Acidobacteriaceae bacterium]